MLIRALEPVAGLERMRARRGGLMRGRPRDRDLCSGPGKLTQALGVSLGENGSSLSDGPIQIAARSGAWLDPHVSEGRRVGITRAVELPWRFSVAGNVNVSSPRPRAA